MKLTKSQQQKLEQLADRFGLVLILIFGSEATGAVTPLSDLDLGVFPVRGRQFSLEEHLQLIGAFKELFTREDIDVVLLHEAGPLLRYEALTNGQVLIERDSELREEQHVRALRDYEDIKDLLNVQHAAMDRRLREGTFGTPV